jgi:hypothetical protein
MIVLSPSIPAGSYISVLNHFGANATYTIIVADSLKDSSVILSVATTSALNFNHDLGLLTFDAPLC